MTKKIELLAPAGNYDAFLAAVENGADAVYLGGKLLNARQFAGNFDEDTLQKAIDYAHVRGVKILLTLNTLVLDEEMQEAVEYAAKVYEMGVDAFIVQDLGLAANLEKAIPGIPLHASTQMTIYNLEGVKALEKMGFERVVLARELNLDEIREISLNTNLEIEVFVHGALCISYSGQCLMSSMIGGRSGNRGKCAQPCRMYYTVAKDNKNLKSSYALSPKDICFIEHLGDLVKAGVSSLKIEGRMKSPEYVAEVVSTYRKYLDMLDLTAPANPKVSEADRHRLLQSFNRGGFSKGYLLGKTGPDMMAYHKPKNWGTYLGTALAQDRNTNSVKIKLENTLGNGDGIEIWSGRANEESPGGIITKIVVDRGPQVKRANAGDTVWVSVIKGNIEKGSKVYKTSDKAMLEQAASTYAKPSRKIEIMASFRMKAGELPVFTLTDKDGSCVKVKAEVLPERAVNKPLTAERISEQLQKMGSTPFNIVKLDLEIDEDIVIPISELNNVRRKAAELLERERILSGKPELSLTLESENNEENMTSSHKKPLCFQLNQTYFPGNMSDYNEKTVKNVKLSAMLYNLNKNIELDKISADRIYIPFSDILNADISAQIKEVRGSGKEIFAYVPAVIKGKQTVLLKKNIPDIHKNTDGFLVGNVGTAELVRNLVEDKVRLMGDYTLNALNSSALHYFKEYGFQGTALSYELNLQQLSEMYYPDGFDNEVAVYGRIPVMTSEYCPVGGSVGNAAPHKCETECKNGVYHLRDRKNAAFLVKCDCVDCRSTIFNADILFAPELMGNIFKTGISHIRMSFVDESSNEIYQIVDMHRQMTEKQKISAAGEKIIETIKSRGITKGHLQRGV